MKLTSNSKEELMTTKQCQFCFKIYDRNVFYQCPRCNYQTEHKTNMRNHLYKNKKPCPATHKDLEITEDIKEKILNNRIYRSANKKNQQSVINNIVYNMNNIEKINTLLEHEGKNLIGYGDKVELKIYPQIKQQ